MKIIKREQARKYSNGKTCNGFEFDLGTRDLDGAVVNVSGRYPNIGSAVNEECREIAFVIEGSGHVGIDGLVSAIEQEDLVIIEKGEHFYWEGDLRLFVYCTPAWSPSQHKHTN